ncbi:MAG: hypothetical protein ABI955_03395 [Nitrospirota bacterium]
MKGERKEEATEIAHSPSARHKSDKINGEKSDEVPIMVIRVAAMFLLALVSRATHDTVQSSEPRSSRHQ